MLVIFPFEEQLYRDAGVPVTFVGHPLVSLVRPATDPLALRRELGLDPERPVVALLPGSRPKEVAHNLPPIAASVDALATARPELQFVAAVAASLDPDVVRGGLGAARHRRARPEPTRRSRRPRRRSWLPAPRPSRRRSGRAHGGRLPALALTYRLEDDSSASRITQW
jgi:hypothetical protein